MDGLKFIEIGRVKGVGNSTRDVTYKYTDLSPINGGNYYRLKQTDYDGKFAYSAVNYLDQHYQAKLNC